MGIKARIEVMRMEILSKGTVTLNENGIHATISYGVPESQQVTNVNWDAADSDQLEILLHGLIKWIQNQQEL